MSNKEKALLWVALALGAALFVGAIVEGVKHSGKHGTTYPTRTEFNAVVNQHKQWQEKRDSQFSKVLDVSKDVMRHAIKQDSVIRVLRAELDRIKSEYDK